MTSEQEQHTPDEDCGCESGLLGITYCPMHKAAPAMLAVMEVLIADMEGRAEFYKAQPETRHLNMARRALAQARPQEPA